MAKSFDKQWYPFHHDLFNRSVSGWGAERVGAYILLLNHQWQNNGIPKDREELIFIARCSDTILDKVLPKFQSEKNGKLFNKKMEIIRKQQKDKYEKRANAGSKGGIAKKQNSSNAKAKPKQSSTIKTKIKSNTIYLTELDYIDLLSPLTFKKEIKNALVIHFRVRKAKNKPITKDAAKLLINKVETLIKSHGEEITLAQINLSSESSWDSFYPPNGNNKETKPTGQLSRAHMAEQKQRRN